MSFIDKISNICGKWLASKVPNTVYETVEDQIDVYSYGFQVIIGVIIKGVVLVGSALLFGVLKEALLILLTFSSLRILAGGFHFSTYIKCISESTISFVLTGLIVKYTYPYWLHMTIITLLVFTMFSGLYVIVRYVPKDTPNKRINKIEDIKKFKKWSMFYLIGWSIFMTLCLFFSFNIVLISSSFGLLLELFSIIPFGYNLYSAMDRLKI